MSAMAEPINGNNENDVDLSPALKKRKAEEGEERAGLGKEDEECGGGGGVASVGTDAVAAASAAPARLDPADARKLLAALSQEQITEALQSALLRHADVLEDVRRHADADPTRRKIFVRGLGWETNSESLKRVFSHYGDIEEGAVIMDKSTGKSRGYGFVTYKHMDGAIASLKEPSKRIDGRMVVCRLAVVGPTLSQQPQDIATRKLYVGNIPLDLPADRLLNYFTQYGEIEEGPLGFDKQTGRARGFALFIYKTTEATQRALEEPTKIIDGHQVFCKLATEGPSRARPYPGQDFQVSQEGGGGGGAPPPPYGTTSSTMTSGGSHYNQNANPTSLNMSVHPSMQNTSQSFSSGTNPSQNTTMNSSAPSHNLPLVQGMQGSSTGIGQAPTSLGSAPYSTQVQTPYSSQMQAPYTQSQAPYSQSQSSYSQSQAPYSQSQPSYTQSQTPYSSQTQTSYTQSQVPYSSQTHAPYTSQSPTYTSQTASYGGGQPLSYPPSGPAPVYGVPQATYNTQMPSAQPSGQYVMPSYQNQQALGAGPMPRPPSSAPLQSMPPYYSS